MRNVNSSRYSDIRWKESRFLLKPVVAALVGSLVISTLAVAGDLPLSPTDPDWNQTDGFAEGKFPVTTDGQGNEIIAPISQDTSYSQNTIYRIPLTDTASSSKLQYVINPSSDNLNLNFDNSTLRFDIDGSNERFTSFLTLKHQNVGANATFKGNNLEARFTSNSQRMIWLSKKNSSLTVEAQNIWLEMDGATNTDNLLETDGKITFDIANDLVFKLKLSEDTEKAKSYKNIIASNYNGRIDFDAQNLYLLALGQTSSDVTALRFEGQSLEIGQKNDTVFSMDNFVIRGANNGIYVQTFKGSKNHLNANAVFLEGINSDSSNGFGVYGTQDFFLNTNSLNISKYENAIWAKNDAFFITQADQIALEGNLFAESDARIIINATGSSIIKGDLTAKNCGKIELTLHKTLLTGSTKVIKGGEDDKWVSLNIKLGDESLWTVTDTSNVSSLNVGASTIDLTSTPINDTSSLTVDRMWGTGTTFILNTAANTPALSLISTGASSEVGTHYLQLGADGNKAESFADKVQGENLRVLAVKDESGKLRFEGKETVTGQGLWKEKVLLESETFGESGLNWYVTGMEKSIGPTVVAIESGLENNYLFLRSPLETTRERFGDLRRHHQTGAWGRITAGFLDNATISNKYQIYRLGADTLVNDYFFIGAAIERFEGKIDAQTGNGNTDATTGTVYSLAVFENQTYMDAGFRFGRLDYNYQNTSLVPDSYDYDSDAFGAWLEIGHERSLKNNWILSPHASVTFGYFGTEDITSANGLSVRADNLKSLVFRAGSDIGYRKDRCSLTLTADLLKETKADRTINFSNGTENLSQHVDYSDTWAEFGFGISFEPTDRSLVWANIKASAWADLEEDWRLNAGARITF